MIRTLTASIAWMIAAPAQAADLYVCAVPGVCSLDSECTAAPADCFDTVAGAIAAGSVGDTIYLSDETYAESITIDGVNLTLIGQGMGTTVLDAPTGDQTVYFDGTTSSLSGVTVTCGGAANRRGIHVDGGVVTLNEVEVRDCEAVSGAGILVDGFGALDLEDGILADNVATDRGAHVHVTMGGASIAKTTLTGGTAATGGAIAIESSSVLVAGSTLTDNHADSEGGAISVFAATAIVRDSAFETNDAGLGGGAITAVLSDMFVDNNRFRRQRQCEGRRVLPGGVGHPRHGDEPLRRQRRGLRGRAVSGGGLGRVRRRQLLLWERRGRVQRGCAARPGGLGRPEQQRVRRAGRGRVRGGGVRDHGLGRRVHEQPLRRQRSECGRRCVCLRTSRR